MFLIVITLLTGCQQKENKPVEKRLDLNLQTYQDDNPIKIGLYEDINLVKEYQTRYTNMKDIGSFYVYYTDEEKLSSRNAKYNWKKYYDKYDDIDKYKIGFIISFDAEGKHLKEQILDPNCEFIFSPYIYLYLYDDIHQPDGSWYSHLKKEDVKENTIYSSIKLFMADKGDKIESPIKLSVFTYDNDDFDNEGNYIGKSKYTITINGN